MVVGLNSSAVLDGPTIYDNIRVVYHHSLETLMPIFSPFLAHKITAKLLTVQNAKAVDVFILES